MSLGRIRTIWRAAAAKPNDPVMPDTPHAPGLPPIPGGYAFQAESKAKQHAIVPALCVGMPFRTLCVHSDAERQSLRYHAERGNDQTTQAGGSGSWLNVYCCSTDPSTGSGGIGPS